MRHSRAGAGALARAMSSGWFQHIVAVVIALAVCATTTTAAQWVKHRTP
jgi:hypothetical protein